MKYIIEEYKTLPFAKRWIFKKFNEFRTNFALRILEREKILHQHNQLLEKSKGFVSQAEHTLIVDDPIKVVTK